MNTPPHAGPVEGEPEVRLLAQGGAQQIWADARLQHDGVPLPDLQGEEAGPRQGGRPAAASAPDRRHVLCPQSRQELEQHSVDTASTSDAVTFITYVQSLKRKIKQFEKQVEVSSVPCCVLGVPGVSLLYPLASS